jgi:branched-chain amino acid transport system ATP-binding protein
MMFQSYALFPHMNVEQNVAFGLKQDRIPKPQIQERVATMLGLVKLGDFAKRKPHQLSGGQRQRVALARSLVKRPKLLLLDEPSAGLAPVVVQQVFELVKRIRASGLTVLIVEQNVQQVLKVVDRAYLLEAGHIRASGTSAEMMNTDTIKQAYLGV